MNPSPEPTLMIAEEDFFNRCGMKRAVSSTSDNLSGSRPQTITLLPER
jgi:hypothetical protein